MSRALPQLKALSLVSFVLATASLGVWAQKVEPTPPPTRPTPPAAPNNLFKPIPKPENPAKARGTFVLNGETITVTEGQLYEAYLIVKPHEEKKESPMQPAQMIERILLIAEAKALGLYPTPEEVDLLNPVKNNPMMGQQLADRLAKMGVSPEQHATYLADTRAITRLKDWFASSARIRSTEAYESWKRENLLYKIEYAAFPAKAQEEKLRAAPPSEKTLQEFWASNVEVQSKYRTQTTVSAEIVWFDPSAVKEEELVARRAATPVTEQAAMTYFTTHRERLMTQIPSDQRPRLYPAPGTKPSLGELVTPFQVLRPIIEREILLGNRITEAFAAAKGAGASADLAGLAKTHGVHHVKINAEERRMLLESHHRFGPNLFQDLFGAEVGAYCPALIFQNGLQFFWRAEGKAASALPEFAAVMARLAEDWYAAESFVLARNEAKTFLDAVEAAANGEFAKQFADLDAQAIADGEKEIADRKLTATGEQEEVRLKHRSLAESKKRRLRIEAAPRHFTDVAKSKGIAVKDLAPFANSYQMSDRSAQTDPGEQIRSFFINTHQLRALEPGQNSAILSDTVTNTHFIARLISKEEPTFEAMPAVDFLQRRKILETSAVFNGGFRWSIFQLQRRMQWKDAQ